MGDRDMAIYEYRAECRRVIDGRTVLLEVELGFNKQVTAPFLLKGIGDSTEKAAELVRSLLLGTQEEHIQRGGSRQLLIHTESGSNGEYIARVMVFGDYGEDKFNCWTSVSDILVDKGLAAPF